MKNRFLVMLSMAAILFTSCSKVPQAEIDAANVAIEVARNAGADLYAHDQFVALQDSMNGIMVAIEEQGSKFIKNYSASKEQLVGMVQFAETVTQQADIRKEELKVEIQATMSEVKTLIETNQQLILEAPKGKEGTTALLAIKEELNTIELTIGEANSLLEGGEYLASLDKIKAAKEKAGAINTELSEVIAKYKTNVRGKKA